MSIKEIISSNGKKKYQALIYFGDEYFGSKTFQQPHLAQAWHDQNLAAAQMGTMLSAAQRKQRKAEQAAAAAALALNEAALEQKLSYFADRFVREQAGWASGKVGKSRCGEMQLIARIVEEICPGITVSHFHGAAGVALIKQFTPKLFAVRRSRTGQGRGVSSKSAEPTKPLAAQTVRLRLTALFKLLRFARKCLPPSVIFEVPAMDDEKEFGWALPPAHRQRKRQAANEELAKLLVFARPHSALGVLIQVLDETGCRLGEVAGAHGHQVTLFRNSNEVVYGGRLKLYQHKTIHKTLEERDVPLSAVAARLLARRIEQHGGGALFPEFRSSDDVCKEFAEACRCAGLRDLVTKDLRRGFLNRNKHEVSELDMCKIFGESFELEREVPDQQAAAAQKAMGHRKVRTTKGYVVPHMEELSRRFTATSRHAAVMALVAGFERDPAAVRPHRAKPLQAPAPVDRASAPSPSTVALAQAMGVSLDAGAYRNASLDR